MLITSTISFAGHNYAQGMPAKQKSNFGALTTFGPRIAVDGITTNSATTPVLFSNTMDTANQWWKVDLQKTIIFQYARIYPRNAGCGAEACGKWDRNI